MLAVRARTDKRAVTMLSEAVGVRACQGIVEFWEDEFEV